MKFQKHDTLYVICLDLGEKIKQTLTSFCEREHIYGGFISGLGAVSEAEIAHYPLSEKRYNTQRFVGEYEVMNLTGNVASLDGKPFLHLHITLGDREYHAFGGHLVEGIASPTLEVLLTHIPGLLTRKHDEATGLKLLDL